VGYGLIGRAVAFGAKDYRFDSYYPRGVCQSGQMEQAVNLSAYAYGGSNPSIPIGGCSSVGRAPNCDFGCRGFESHQSPFWGINSIGRVSHLHCGSYRFNSDILHL
jgi:hypothetical protein